MHGEERVVAACKRFLQELPAHTHLTVVEGHPGDLDDIRRRITQTRDEINRLRSLPVPSDDLADRVKRYVDELAAHARPVMQGIGHGQTLRVLYPLRENADRTTQSGFSQHEGNPLLLLALLAPERLTEQLLQTALSGGIPASELHDRLQKLQQHLTQLRYDEEASISATNGDAEPIRIDPTMGGADG